MTTGGYTVGRIGFGRDQNGFYATCSWSGADGKYVSGRQLKSNAYSKTWKTQVYSTYPGKYVPDCGSWPGLQWTDNDELALLSSLKNAIQGHGFNMSVFLGEGHESLKTITNTVTAIHQSVKSLRRGDIAGAARALGRGLGQTEKKKLSKRLSSGDISGAWLSLQYGWKPLLSDCFEAAKAYEALTAPPRVVTFSVHKRKEKTFDSSASPTNYHGFGSRVDRVGLKYRLVEQLSQPRSLGLLDPASLAWELLPFSFVADWFIPIGTYIEDLMFFPFLSGSCERTVLTRVITRSVGTEMLSPQSDYYCCSDAWTYGSFARVPSYSIVVPRPQLKDWAKALTAGHLENAAALIHQFVHSFRK